MKKTKFTFTSDEVTLLLNQNLEKQVANIKREAAAILKNPKKHYYSSNAEALEHVTRMIQDASKLGAYDLGNRIRWMPRLKVFRDADGLEYSPITGETSSRRDGLLRVIKGQMYTNGCYTLERIFKVLQIKFTSIHAPAGLNNLDLSVHSLAESYGENMIRAKYGRQDKETKKWRQSNAKDFIREIEVLKKLGADVPKNILERAIERADKARSEELKNKADRRHYSLEHRLEYAQRSGELREIVEATVKLERSKKRRGETTVLSEV